MPVQQYPLLASKPLLPRHDAAVALLTRQIRSLEPLVREIEAQYGKGSRQAKAVRIKLADLYAQRHTAAHPRIASRVVRAPRRSISDEPIASFAELEEGAPRVVPIRPVPAGRRVNRSPLAKRAKELPMQAAALKQSIDVRRTKGGGKYPGMEADLARLQKLSTEAERANDLLKSPPEPEVTAMWTKRMPSRGQIEQDRKYLVQQLAKHKKYARDSANVQWLLHRIGQHDDLLAGRKVRGEFYPLTDEERAEARAGPQKEQLMSAKPYRAPRSYTDKELAEYRTRVDDSNHELAGMSYAEFWQRPAQELSQAVADVPAAIVDEIGHQMDPAMSTRGWYFNDKERRATADAIANSVSYLVPGFGQIKGILDTVATAARVAEVGPSRFAKESWEGIKRVSNPFEPGLTAEERYQRSINLAGIVYGLAHGAVKAKGAVTEFGIAQKLIHEHGFTAKQAGQVMQRARSALAQINAGRDSGRALTLNNLEKSGQLRQFALALAEDQARSGAGTAVARPIDHQSGGSKGLPDPSDRGLAWSLKGKDSILRFLKEEYRAGSMTEDDFNRTYAHVKSLPPQLLRNVEVFFEKQSFVENPDRSLREVSGLYDPPTQSIKINRSWNYKNPGQVFPTMAHEIGHHLERWLSKSDFEKLHGQYVRARSAFKGDPASAPHLKNLQEWWASELEYIVREPVAFELSLRGKPALQKVYLRAVRMTREFKERMYYKLRQDANTDHATQVYREIVRLKRVENALSPELSHKYKKNTGGPLEP